MTRPSTVLVSVKKSASKHTTSNDDDDDECQRMSFEVTSLHQSVVIIFFQSRSVTHRFVMIITTKSNQIN